jgi:uncharacterized cupredoxin-like copper-binding protein
MFKSISFFFAAAALVASASAAGESARAPDHAQVRLSSFNIAPATLTLVHGRSYILELINFSGNAHDFTAPDFFAVAAVGVKDRAKIDKGRIEVASGHEAQIALTPLRSGDFEFHCSHPLHTLLGMKGHIHVL